MERNTVERAVKTERHALSRKKREWASLCQKTWRYGIKLIPVHIFNIIQRFYANFTCSISQSDMSFEGNTGVRQGCVMSAILFCIVTDWILRRTTEDEPRGIRWTLFLTLEDLDFADDLCRWPSFTLPSSHPLEDHTTQHFQTMVGLKISVKKTEVMTVNTTSPSPVKVGQHELPSYETLTYLGSIISQDGGN